MANDENKQDQKRRFGAQIGNHTFDFRTVRFDDQKVVGAQIAAAANAHPIENFAILQHLKSGELESIRPTETVDLANPGVERFFVIEGSSNHRFTTEGLSMEWAQDILAAKHIKFLANADDDTVLVIDRDDGDHELADEELVDLSQPGVERFKLRKKHKPIVIVVNAEKKAWDGPKITFEQVVKLAFPEGHEGENWSFTVAYRRGQPPKPEGTMIAGDVIKTKEKMIFNVTATDKS